MRKVDRLGRIVIPKELREKYGLFEGRDIEFKDNGVGIVVKSVESVCRICERKIPKDSVIPLCKKCIFNIKQYDNEKSEP